MDDFIRPLVISQCMGHQLTYKWGGDGMVKTKYLDSDTFYLIEEKDQEHLI